MSGRKAAHANVTAFICFPSVKEVLQTLGKFKQTTGLFHRIFCNTTDGGALNRFLISQKNATFSWLKLGSS